MCHKTSISARCRWSTRFTKASTQPSLAVPAPMDAAKWSPWRLEVVCRVSLMTLKCSCINLAIRLSRQKVWSNGCRPCHWVQKEELPLGSAEGDLGSNPPILRRGSSRQIVKSQPRRPRFGQGQLGKQILRMSAVG